uniref:Uncharacterized protein n=1 Tax=Arundo donax TaxID=35708 RepID=A0A0A9DY74_ARUDO
MQPAERTMSYKKVVFFPVNLVVCIPTPDCWWPGAHYYYSTMLPFIKRIVWQFR